MIPNKKGSLRTFWRRWLLPAAPTIRTTSIHLLASIPLSLGINARASGLPTRSECIVKVVSNAPASTRSGQSGLNTLMPYARAMEFPLAGYHIAGPNVVHIQFRRRCSECFEMSKTLFSAVFPAEHITISTDVVKPHPSTIDLVGNSWRDRPEGWDR